MRHLSIIKKPVSRVKLFGRIGATNINMDDEYKLTWRQKRHAKLVEAMQRNPHRISPRPDIKAIQRPDVTVVQRPRVIDIGQIPVPDNTIDLFDMLPTLTVARRATLERMQMNKILSYEDEYLLNQESQEFDDEIRGDMQDAFGNPEMQQRQAQAELMQKQMPDAEPGNDFMPISDFDRPGPPRRRDNLDQNLI